MWMGLEKCSQDQLSGLGCSLLVLHNAVQSKAMRDSCFPQSTAKTINTVHTAFVYFMVLKNTFMVL